MVKQLNLITYECKIEIKNITAFTANTKYSEFDIENANIIFIGAYEDKLKIQNLTDGLTGQAKYSDFEIESDVKKNSIRCLRN